MRNILILLTGLLFVCNAPLMGQKVIKKISAQTCDCLEEFTVERDEEIIREVINRCVTAAVEENGKGLVKTFGSVIESG
ncbi:MAG: hypothetical protein AAGM67_08100, partial [Bacteroidota bacterium]